MTRIVVAESCFDVISRELDRVAPNEGVLLPLVAIEHRCDPCAPIGLSDITSIALAEVRCVPPELQHNSLLRVAALPRSDVWADSIVVPLTRKHPRLRAAAYLHSHPFAYESTSPSGGDIDGHMVPLLARNIDCGLFASLSFIAARAFPDTRRAEASRGNGHRWRLPCFAMDARRCVIGLGNTEVVPDDDPLIVRARAPRSERFHIRRWKQRLRLRGMTVRLDELFDGWVRARVIPPGAAHRVLVVLFPLAFPTEPARYFVVDRRTGRSQRLELAFSLDALEFDALEAA